MLRNLLKSFARAFSPPAQRRLSVDAMAREFTSLRQYVALFGCPLAGKTTILEQVGRSSGAHFESLITETERLLVGTQENALPGLVTFPGAVFNGHLWEPLLTNASKILLVLDPQRATLDQSTELVGTFRHLLPPGASIVAQVTKQDLVERLPARQTISPAELLGTLGLEGIRVELSRDDHPESLLRGLRSLGAIPASKPSLGA